MGYNEKMAEGLVAIGSFTREQVTKLIEDTVRSMEKRAVISSRAENGDLLIGFAMSGAQKAMNFNVLRAGIAAITKEMDINLFADVSMEDIDSGLKVTTSIEAADTTQTKVMGFIPASPKAVLGITTYREFLDFLKSGLLSIDGEAEITVRTQG